LDSTTRIGRLGAADQIIEDLRDLIARREIAQGSRLPSARDLAERYGVSAPTASEAIRGLAAMGLVEIRHGSGSYVTADANSMVTTALATALQIQGVSISEIIELLALINERAVSLAVQRAQPDDLDRLEIAEAAIARGTSSSQILHGVDDYLSALINSAHEPILSLIGTFLTRILTRLQQDMFPRDHKFWKSLTSPLRTARQEIIKALRDGDAERAQAAVRRYHGLAIKRLNDDPISRDARVSDGRFASVITSLISD
jgi:GntR family transcriptional repressor for pyruvate dehydrogenase complex